MCRAWSSLPPGIFLTNCSCLFREPPGGPLLNQSPQDPGLATGVGPMLFLSHQQIPHTRVAIHGAHTQGSSPPVHTSTLVLGVPSVGYTQPSTGVRHTTRALYHTCDPSRWPYPHVILVLFLVSMSLGFSMIFPDELEHSVYWHSPWWKLSLPTYLVAQGAFGL